MWGFTAPDWDPDRFQGFHEENVMVVIDEAAGVSTAIYDAIDAVLSSANVKRLEIGNPTDDAGGFGKSFKQEDVKKFTIRAWDTPNLKDFGITEADILSGEWEKLLGSRAMPYPQLVTPAWVAKRARRWGIESPMYRSRVQAEFPIAGSNSLIPMGWYQQAKDRVIRPKDNDPNVIGVDVARYGDDESVVCHRHGGHFRTINVVSQFSTVETAGIVARALLDTGATCAAVDGVGVGAGVVDSLRANRQPVTELNAGARARNPGTFFNAKAEWYWKVRELFQQGEIDVDPDDEELEIQATQIRYKVLPSGQIKIEEKDEYKKRTGLRSPDRFEALVHAVAEAEFEPLETW